MTKVCPKCYTEKSFIEFHKHSGKPFGLAVWCKECAKANALNHYKNQDPTLRLEKKRKWQDKNRERVNHYNNEWRKANPHKHSERQSRRRAEKLSATPKWLEDHHKAHIKRTYKLARFMTEVTGESYHVDHIIPLKGKNVCGLHVPENLQVMPARLNLKKSNKLEGELN